jgi:predicted dehydrogenase
MIEFKYGGSPQQLILHRFPGTDVWQKDGAKGGDMGAGAGSELARETVLFEHEDKGKHVDLEMDHFLDCIEKGLEPFTDGASSLQGLRVIWKLYEAEDQGVVADLRGLGLPDK